MDEKEELKKEESNESRLTDLPVADEPAETAKAGYSQRIRKVFFATSQDVGGGVVS